MEIHKDLGRMRVIAVLQAIEHNCKYNLVIHNHVDGKFDVWKSTYETVMDSYFEKERPNVVKLYDTDHILDNRETFFDPAYLKIIRDKEIEMNNIRLFSKELSVMPITNPYPEEDEPVGKVKQVVDSGPDINRNDPCHCGSGLKFKKCCINK